MIKNYFKSAIRNFRKNKSYNFLNIFGLAIGIACAGLIFLWAEDEKQWDNNFSKKDRLYQVKVNMTFDGNSFTMGSTPRPMAAAIIKEIPGIINAARFSDGDERLLFNFNNKALYATGRYTDSSFFSMFNFSFVEGDPINPFPQLYSLVITESTSKKVFGNTGNVVGKIIRVDNKQDYIVTGVIKDLPGNTSLQFDWLAPYAILSSQSLSRQGVNDDETNWGSYGPFTYVELSRSANLAGINNTLKTYIKGKASIEKAQTFLFPMKDWRLYDDFVNGKESGGGRITQLRLLVMIAWIILMIACINFMNLATASGHQRAKEVGVRKVLGAERKRLVVQFMVEAILQSCVATLVAVVFIILLLPSFNSLMQKQIELNPGNFLHLAYLLFIALFCGLIAGSYPSLYLSSFNATAVLKGLKIKGKSVSTIRKGLVILQFIVSIVFIISTIVMYQQIEYVKNRQLGFNKDNLIEINPEHGIASSFPVIRNELLQTGVVANVSLTDHSTLYGGNSDDGFRWPGMKDNKVGIFFRSVSPDFINTSGMKIIDGKDFAPDENPKSHAVIINETLQSIMGKGSAVGKTIQSPRGNPEDIFTNLTVVGVVKNYLFGNMYDGGVSPLLLYCDSPSNLNYIYVRLRAKGNEVNALSKIEAIMKKNNPAYPLEYRFVDDQFNEFFQNEKVVSSVSAIFASLAIVISCLGLFGLAAYTAEQRTKEIGIRKVLGASVTGITALLSKDFLQLVGYSCLVAFPASWWIMNNWLRNYEYRTNIHWWIFPLAGFAAMIIALITIGFRSIKAAMANPVKNLRTE